MFCANNVDPDQGISGLEVIKNFMITSAEHEILNAHKYKNIKKFSIFRLR